MCNKTVKPKDAYCLHHRRGHCTAETPANLRQTTSSYSTVNYKGRLHTTARQLNVKWKNGCELQSSETGKNYNCPFPKAGLTNETYIGRGNHEVSQTSKQNRAIENWTAQIPLVRTQSRKFNCINYTRVVRNKQIRLSALQHAPLTAHLISDSFLKLVFFYGSCSNKRKKGGCETLYDWRNPT